MSELLLTIEGDEADALSARKAALVEATRHHWCGCTLWRGAFGQSCCGSSCNTHAYLNQRSPHTLGCKILSSIDYSSHPAFRDFAGLGQADDAVLERLIQEIDGEIAKLSRPGPTSDEAGLKSAFLGEAWAGKSRNCRIIPGQTVSKEDRVRESGCRGRLASSRRNCWSTSSHRQRAPRSAGHRAGSGPPPLSQAI